MLYPTLPFNSTNTNARAFLDRMTRMHGEAREVSQIKRLTVQGSLEVVVFRVSTPQLVVFSTDAQTLKRLRTEIRDPETLAIFTEPHTRVDHHHISASRGSIAASGDVTIVHASGGTIAAGGNVIINGVRMTGHDDGDILVGIGLPASPHVKLTGSGEVILFDIDQSSTTLALAGSGTIRPYGIVQNLMASVSGSGELQADNLIASSAVIGVTGSGSIDAVTTEAAEAQVMGSGSISLRGNPPRLNRSVIGSGSVDAR